MDDARLAAVLRSVGEHLDFGPTADPTADVSLRSSVVRRLVAAVAAVLAVTLVLVSPVGASLRDWLGIGATTVVVAPGDVGVSSARLGDLGEPIDLADAAVLLGTTLPDLEASPLGPATRLIAPPEGGVLVEWSVASTTLWVRRSAHGEAPWLEKRRAHDGDVVAVEGLGDEAMAVIGDHELVTPIRSVGSSSVVLWVSGQLELRLEADEDLDALVDLAARIAAWFDLSPSRRR